jgi:hypothetical protein
VVVPTPPFITGYCIGVISLKAIFHFIGLAMLLQVSISTCSIHFFKEPSRGGGFCFGA